MGQTLQKYVQFQDFFDLKWVKNNYDDIISLIGYQEICILP